MGWYRIDKSNGAIEPWKEDDAFDSAEQYFDSPDEVLLAGRFQTPYAIYSLGSMLSDAERVQLHTTLDMQ